MKGNSRERGSSRLGRSLVAVIVMGAALAAASPADASQLSAAAQAMSRTPEAAAPLRIAGGPPCEEPCAEPPGYADRGYDPIAREIERLEPAPAPGACEEGPYVERRRVVPDSSGLCGIRCWYWRLRHGYCGPGCEWYRYWAHERRTPPGPRPSRYACRN